MNELRGLDDYLTREPDADCCRDCGQGKCVCRELEAEEQKAARARATAAEKKRNAA